MLQKGLESATQFSTTMKYWWQSNHWLAKVWRYGVSLPKQGLGGTLLATKAPNRSSRAQGCHITWRKGPEATRLSWRNDARVSSYGAWPVICFVRTDAVTLSTIASECLPRGLSTRFGKRAKLAAPGY